MPDGRDAVTVKVLSSIGEVSPAAWDACAGAEHPFTRHAFLSALEDSGSADADSGWHPRHVVIEDGLGGLVAAAPLYLKTHSYGEYVFDWGWAEAYDRAGGNYYPKLQCAVPFTPATGPRLLVAADRPEDERDALADALAAAMIQLAEQMKLSSLHVTFPTAAESRRLAALGMMQRTGQQYHWENRDYAGFDDFLGQLASRKRKQIKKERRCIADNGLTVQTLRGADIEERHWDAFYQFYRNTTDRKWGPSYLTRDFFSLLGQRLGDAVVLIFVEDGARPVAGALNLAGGDTLYGRNWGCADDYKFLHFETCYYQAIDFAIAHGLARVEAGAQGTHKIQRGYLPSATYSAHWIADPALRQPVQRFLDEERRAVAAEIAALAAHSPYRQDDSV